MFGVGASELVIIGVVLLIAVGPTRLPKLIKAVVSSYRELRRATRELRASTGIDELLQDEDLRDLRKPLDLEGLGKPLGAVPTKGKGGKPNLVDEARESPPEGVDLRDMRDVETRPSEEEREAIRAAKQARFESKKQVKRAKGNTSGRATTEDSFEEGARALRGEVSAEEQAIIDAKNQAVVDAKIAAAQSAEDATPEDATPGDTASGDTGAASADD